LNSKTLPGEHNNNGRHIHQPLFSVLRKVFTIGGSQKKSIQLLKTSPPLMEFLMIFFIKRRTSEFLHSTRLHCVLISGTLINAVITALRAGSRDDETIIYTPLAMSVNTFADLHTWCVYVRYVFNAVIMQCAVVGDGSGGEITRAVY